MLKKVILLFGLVTSQMCPYSMDMRDTHYTQCLSTDDLYFKRPMTHNPINNEFDGKTRIYVPPKWFGHYLVYHNVGIKDNTLYVWGQTENELRQWTRFVRRYQISYGNDNQGRDIPMELNYFENPLTNIEQTCDVIHDEISFLITPVRINNNFHLHNDVLIPTFVDIIESGSLFNDIKAFVYTGDIKQKKRAVLLYWILDALFDGKVFNYEETFEETTVVNQGNKRISKTKLHCFKTMIWGQNRVPPWYNHENRFGMFNSFQSQVYYYQYYTFTKLGIPFDNFVENGYTYKRDVVTRKPRIIWITRMKGKRRMGNLGDVLTYFNAKGYDIKSCCDWSKLKIKPNMTLIEKESVIKEHILEFYDYDIMIGLHGAGLTNILYMKPGSILIELKVPYGFAWASFANIASFMGIGYYTGDVRRFCNPLCNFPKKYIKKLIDEMNNIYINELKYGNDMTREFENGKYCALLPAKRSDIDILTPFNQSRCYHSQMGKRKDEWFQLFDHSDYTDFIYKKGGSYGIWMDPDNKL